MAITAKKLASQLGLSTAAVSMALNNKPGVSERTRERVLQAAREADFDFGSLRRKEEDAQRKTIVFLLYKRHGAVVGDTLFFSALTDGVADACRAAGYRLSIRYLYGENAQQELQSLLSENLQGAILLGTELRKEDFGPFAAFPLPLVVLDTYFEGINRDCMLINNIQGAFLATNYLIQKRKKQPGYLRSAYSIGNFEERADGFYKAIRYNGMAAGGSVVHRLTPSIEGAYSDMKVLLTQGEPLAECYFADNDLIAAGAMRAFKEKGYRIPEDIGIIGFDNTSMCELLSPSLTTIHVPKQAMGRLAVQQLISILSDRNIATIKIELMTSLVKRGSL